jgi:2-keto-4-pentenoate hydratase/2-oxohepta-3-ene-1,7-dioic acid hydratase in catechol pathway
MTVRLCSFTADAVTRVGLILGDEVADLARCDAGFSSDLRLLLASTAGLPDRVARAAPRAPRLALAGLRLEAPVRSPRKFLGLGMSYRSHAEEIRRRGGQIPAHQHWFNKQVTAVSGPYDPIYLPRVSSQLDYEGELAIVIGRGGRHIRRHEAHEAIAGFMICNDVSARDWQRRAPTATLGKSFDTHGPTGPWLTTIDEIADAGRLGIRTWVDGELRQNGSTAELLFSFGEMIEELSTVFTLEPGDILTTGTPAGVGQYRDPPSYLRVGQTVRIAIEGLGEIENTVIAEPEPDSRILGSACRSS